MTIHIEKYVLPTLLALTTATWAGAPAKAPDLTPVKMQPAPKHAPVELVREGQPRAVIYLGEAPLSDRVRLLVQEMVETIRLSSGATLPIMQVAPPADQPAIVIGDCEASRKAGINAAKIPVEGFVVKTATNRIYLVGSTQALPAGSSGSYCWANEGTAWAVADFLERFVGVRWYWPVDLGGRCITPAASLAVPPVSYADQPAFRMRDYFPPEGWALPGKARWNDKEPLPFAPGAIPAGVAKVDMPGYLPLIRGGSSWPYRVTVHMPQQLWRWNSPDWLKAHEKMFALGGNGTKLNEDGTRSWSLLCYSAPETLKYLLDGCEAKWDKKDNGVFPSWVTTPSVSVSPFDQPVKCQCEACQATWKKGGASLIMGLFVKQMCEEVKKRWPDKKVIYHPYWNYQGCPEGVDYPDNLEIIVSMSGGPMALMRQDGMRRGTEANLHAWSKKVGGLIANWDYPDRGSAWTHGPVQFPHVVQDFYRTNRTILAGTYLNGSDLPDWTTSAPTLYVWMKILWNPELDVDAVLDEMCQRLYGKAGGTVRELLQLECDRWEKASWPAPLPDQGTIPPRVFRGIWPADVVARMKSLRDKALAELADDPVGKQRFLYWTWTFDAFLKDAVTVQQEEKL